MKKALLGLSAVTGIAIMSLSANAAIQSESPSVATVVEIAIPPGAPKPFIIGKFKEQAPVYEKASGLLRKYFTINDKVFGGVYLWRDKASADAWFTQAWRDRAKTSFGSEPNVTYYDAPVLVDNTQPNKKGKAR